jgi:hypothetical protein
MLRASGLPSVPHSGNAVFGAAGSTPSASQRILAALLQAHRMVLTVRLEHTVPSSPLDLRTTACWPRSEAQRHPSPEDNSAAFNEPLLTSRWVLRVRLVQCLFPTPLSSLLQPAPAATKHTPNQVVMRPYGQTRRNEPA